MGHRKEEAIVGLHTITGLVSLEKECCAEDPVGHREGGEHARDPGQSSAGLGQNQHIGHRVADPGDHEDPEVEHSGGQVRSSQGIEQANHDEGNDVLQVILVASG